MTVSLTPAAFWLDGIFPLSTSLRVPRPMKPSTQLRLSRTHRALGVAATIPIVGWILSSFVLHGVGLALPNGLQGVYELQPFHAESVSLEDESFVSPAEVLAQLAADGIERLYWLRLELLGSRVVYTVKPGPFELERIYDARTAERIDPLSDELLRAVADAQLTNTTVAALHEGDEFNRYYTRERVPAVVVEMTGDQTSELVFSRSSGRVMRRTDPMAGWFHKAYTSVHVWQWGDNLRLFTSLLYALAGVGLTLVALGYTLWWTRRDARRRWTDAVRPVRRIHARLAPVAGFLLVTQMLVGAFLWYNLGLIEPRFRGQGSFEEEWQGGISVTEQLASVSTIAEALPVSARSAGHPIQRYEWRAIGDRRFWIAYASRNENGTLLDAATSQVMDRISPELAAVAGGDVVLGEAAGPAIESTEYWMDFNARVPTYLFRFTDPDDTDVHISQVTGEVVQRRPGIWRAFGPFLLYHTFGFTGNPWFDTLLLSSLQIMILVMVGTGWAMVLGGRKSGATVAKASAATHDT